MSEKQPLLARARRFEPDALRTLHNQFYSRIYRYIYFKVQNTPVSEDLTSDVFMRVLESLKQGNGWKNTPDAWMFGIARNVIADYYRRAPQQPDATLDNQPIIDPAPDPTRHLLQKENYTELAHALTQLSDDYRDVILLRFIEELSIKDVAHILNKTPGAVKGLQFRALQTLSDLMQPLSTQHAAGGAL